MAVQDYQTLNDQLETVLAKLQAPDVHVDEAVKLYEEGLKLIAAMQKHLEQAENKIEKLKLQST
ncbi:MAG TPA: exodeoxyribonuclease VII small subunit [Candidatus Pristimantibacillus sp.]|jgi:exodeoxyribonuclease VII small subunit|nr:exodeoxyribonuclease VII small subunit [Candidatus Pristimantibacillus sp.]